jgi:hypothetical protein
MSPALRRANWVIVLGLSSGCDDPCCVGVDDCGGGFRCVEGLCAAICDADAACLEQEDCRAGICLAVARRSVCPFDEVPR